MSPADFAATAKAKRRSGPPKIPLATWLRWTEETKAMLESGEWAGANEGHLLALYAFCHTKVYGVEAGELLAANTCFLAVKGAKKCLDEDFSGDVARAVGFIRWAWRREEERMRWREANERETTSRIGWRLQFSKQFSTDYRFWLAQQKKK